MARGKTRRFEVDTSPTKEVVVGSLTRDATVEACIFDLVDNSLDAARDASFEAMSDDDQKVLLETYEGFIINLDIDESGVSIADNSGGIEVGALETMAMRFGKRSNHKMGIGVFGVGLNRALFKLGNHSLLSTDTGEEKATVELDNSNYLESASWTLPAVAMASDGKKGTSIRIANPSEDMANVYTDEEWRINLAFELGTRYARFLDKGLTLNFNAEPISAAEPKLRENGPFAIKQKFLRKGDVRILVRCGQHLNHKFVKEKDYSRESNAALTEQFGWTVLCNDRAVLFADRTYRTGWDGKFHSEFYGFVGIVEFISEDPGKLPWATTKTDVDLSDPIYRAALAAMKTFAEQWRSFAEQRKKPNFTLQSLPPQAEPHEAPKSALERGTPSATKTQPPKAAPLKQEPLKKKSPIVKPDYRQYRTILPLDIDEQNANDKHLVLIHEAKNLDLGVFTFSGMALMRMLFEMSVMTYLHRRGKYDELRSAAVVRRKSKGMKIEPADEKKQVPALDEILPYLDNNPNTWEAKEVHLRHSLKRMISYQPILNSAIHNPFQQFNRNKAFEIRDEILPLLRHLIEK